MNEEMGHPAFPQPNDIKVSVWRYLDFDKFEWLIDEERLFFPMAERLRDPLEGAQPTGGKKKQQMQRRKRKRLLLNTIKNWYYVSQKHFCQITMLVAGI